MFGGPFRVRQGEKQLFKPANCRLRGGFSDRSGKNRLKPTVEEVDVFKRFDEIDQVGVVKSAVDKAGELFKIGVTMVHHKIIGRISHQIH